LGRGDRFGVAFHLVKAGRQVALVDKHALGSQTSPRAAGLTSQARGTDLMTQLARRAVRKIEDSRETGEESYSTSQAR
jgi:glycine/D-amino acid oxidase-like deaminating enzyme